jgi:hypothetical protein
MGGSRCAPGTTTSGSPGVITYLAGGIFAFVTGADGDLFVNYWNGSGWEWVDQGVPPGTTASGSPRVITYSAGASLPLSRVLMQWEDQGPVP